jgi:hypothetical protein
MISLVLVMSVRNIVLIKVLGFVIISGLCLSAYLMTRRQRDQFILFPLGIVALSVYIVFHSTGGLISLKILDRIFWLAFASYLCLIVFREIFSSKMVGSKEIYGAISVYILLGFLFSQIYEIILVLNPEALSFDPKNFGGGSLQSGDIIYFSFVTLATVGYGDLVPASPVTRSVCVAESIIGIMYVAIFIARFVSIHSNRSANH